MIKIRLIGDNLTISFSPFQLSSNSGWRVGGMPKNTNFRLLDTQRINSGFSKHSRNYATTIVVDMTHLMVVRTT